MTIWRYDVETMDKVGMVSVEPARVECPCQVETDD